MKKRAKPRGHWDSVVEVPLSIFVEKEGKYSELIEGLRNLPKAKMSINSQEIFGEIKKAQTFYYSGIRSINEMPRMSEVSATMKMLIKGARQWTKILEKVDDKSLEKMLLVCPTDGKKENFTDIKSDREMIWDCIERMVFDTSKIQVCAEKVLSAWERHKKQKNTGAPFDFPFHSYIGQLYEIFHRATGLNRKVTFDNYSELFTGSFVEFAWECFNLIPGRPALTKYAFGSRVRRALQSPIKSYSMQNPIKSH